MAYRRRNSTPRTTTFEDFRSFPAADEDDNSSTSLAAKAIRASAAHRNSSVSSAYDGDPPANLDSSSASSNALQQHPDRRSFHKQVANAMAAKTKLLLRELKTVKADLAFAKQRCTQLEEENKALRENRQKGDSPADDDDLIRHQLETLVAEKARLAHENSVYARENRFLREIVEYHQLTMQDVVYLDEGIEEVSEVYPIHQMTTHSPSRSTHDVVVSSSSSMLPSPVTPQSINTVRQLSMDSPGSPNSSNSTTQISIEKCSAEKS
ncbi:hypothetical protein Cni_G29536 [Canna indica]|uniref:Uncharacterized protein n=1 Tax=Canna indica TaxID=4628 RepID=A0AAQ3QU39_9LILI|nr:hypothetical protein Cni_G29536 [Canna indica]